MRIQELTNQPIQKYNVFKSSSKETPAKPEDELLISTALTQAQKPVKKLKTATAATVAAIGTVCVFFMLSKGFQKNTNLFLNKIKDYLETKQAHTSLNDSKNRKNFYEFFIRRINSFINKSESINNITSLKDILFMKLMYKTKPTKKIHEEITKYFEEISKKTVLKSYEKTKKQFKQMNAIFDELDEYILKNAADETVMFQDLNDDEIKEYTKQALVAKAKYLRDMSNTLTMAFIDKSTINNRYEYINDAMSSLYSKFWDASFKDFWSNNNKFKKKEMWQTFIAAKQIKPNKIEMADCSYAAKNAISYSKTEQIDIINENIKSLDILIDPNDKEGIEIIKKLKCFAKNPEILKNSKELFLEELNKLKEHNFSHVTDDKMVQAIEDYKQQNIDFIDKQINDREPGMFQRMLAYYYKIAPYELEKSGALLSLKQTVKSFEKSVDLESNELFDKVRDLRLGSAPTDVLTIILSFLTLSFGLGHAQEKDKRISIMLKSGIPIIGGIATAMLSAAKLVSGGKSLALGFLSGIVLNQLGIVADNLRIKISNNQKQQNKN